MNFQNGEGKFLLGDIESGQVYRLSLMGEKDEARDEQALFPTRTGFKVLQNDTWIAWYTNAYKDKDDEIFAEKAIEADVARMNETGNYPALWFWHTPGSKHGRAIGVAKVGRFAVAVGKFDDTPMAEAFKAYYDNAAGLGLSHGFLYDARDKKNGVFERYHTFEISVLPQDVAANPYTAYTIKEMNDMAKMTDKQMAAIKEALGDDELWEQLVQNGKAASDELDKAGVEYKSKEDETPDAGQFLIAQMKSIQDTLTKMNERMDKMESDAKPEDDEEEEEEEKPSDKSRSEQSGAQLQDRFFQAFADMLENAEKEKIEDRKAASGDPAGSLFNALVGDSK